MPLPQKKLSKFKIPLGTNIETQNPIELNAEWLRTGIEMEGPTR